jgi:hypothetical protein
MWYNNDTTNEGDMGMASTIRLPEALAQRGRNYAAEVGISLSGLLAIALQEYLESRKPELRMAPLPVVARPVSTQTLAKAIALQIKVGARRK